jgi:hypothetical protein
MLLRTGNKRELAMSCCTLYDNLSTDEIEKKGWDGGLAARIIRAAARAEFKPRRRSRFPRAPSAWIGA